MYANEHKHAHIHTGRELVKRPPNNKKNNKKKKKCADCYQTAAAPAVKIADLGLVFRMVEYLLDCNAWCCGTVRYYCHPSFSVCEQAEKLAVLDHAFTVISMSANIWQLLC